MALRSTQEPIMPSALSANDAATTLRQLADLPSPKGQWPIVGHALSAGRDHIHQYVEAMARQHGSLFRMQLGKRRVLVVADHVLSTQVLKARPDHFRRSNRFRAIALEMGLNMGLFSAEGDTWHRQRRMVMASFAPQRVRAYLPSMLNVTRRLENRWLKACAASSDGIARLDVQRELMRYTVDTITGLAFGHDVNSLEADGDVIQQHLDRIFPSLFDRLVSVLPLWRHFPTQKDKQLAASVAEVGKAIDGFIARSRALMDAEPQRREQPTNLLEAFILAAENEDAAVRDQDVAGNVMTMLLAGEDTTANSLCWMLELMAQHPETIAQARDEVLRLTPQGVGDFSTERIDAMDYLEACVHESMRLKPVAPFLPVEAVHDTVVGDVAVPANTLVWNVLRHDSVSEAHLPDAHRFMPERWLATGEQAVPKHLSMPFGSGPRICPGRYLALLEIKMAAAMLLQRFDILGVATASGQPAEEQMNLAMTPVGLRLNIRPRPAAA
jgi:cytochrome P450